MNDFEHKYNRRSRKQDYRNPAIYHIILKKADNAPVFGSIIGDPHIAPGLPGSAAIERTALGKIIQKEVYDLRYANPAIQIYQYVVMPDHVHILMRIKERLPLAVGSYIAGMKSKIRNKWNEATNCNLLPDANGNVDDGGDLFQKGFTDKIIHPGRNLDTVFRYIKENPHRLAMRTFCPSFFRRAKNIIIAGKCYQAYGNLFHLRNPFKSRVIVHRTNSKVQNELLAQEWMEYATTGGVLVSPFISPLEKRIRDDAINAGGRIIHIQKDPFGERYKPAEKEFNLCCEGKLLIIAPMRTLGEVLTKNICNEMNAIAEALVNDDFSAGSCPPAMPRE